jgi:PAS domain S-box-containing protein
MVNYCNRRWVEYTGASIEAARGRRWLDLVHPDDVDAYRSTWSLALDASTDCEVGLRLKRAKDDAYRWQLFRAVPERDDSGEVTAWLGTLTDFDDVVSMIQSRDEFLSIASHELRTPLTALKLRIQSLVRSARLDDDDRRKAESVERQTARLERLVTSLLDVARAVTGKLVLEPEDFTLGEAVEVVIQRFQSEPMPNQPPLELRVFDACPGHWVRVRIVLVVTELLVNAITYGDGNPVVIVVERVPEGHRFSVTDRGRGIAPSDQERIFQRFGRVGGPRGKASLGVGLYIAHQIVQAHGGTVQVDSKAGFGSTFMVTLPAKSQDSPDAR